MWSETDGEDFQASLNEWLQKPIKTYSKRRSYPLNDVEPILEKIERLSPKKKERVDEEANKSHSKKRKSTPLPRNGLRTSSLRLSEKLRNAKVRMKCPTKPLTNSPAYDSATKHSEDRTAVEAHVSKQSSKSRQNANVFDPFSFVSDKTESESIVGTEMPKTRMESSVEPLTQDSGICSQLSDDLVASRPDSTDASRPGDVGSSKKSVGEFGEIPVESNSLITVVQTVECSSGVVPDIKLLRRSSRSRSNTSSWSGNQSSEEDNIPLAVLKKSFSVPEADEVRVLTNDSLLKKAPVVAMTLARDSSVEKEFSTAKVSKVSLAVSSPVASKLNSFAAALSVLPVRIAHGATEDSSSPTLSESTLRRVVTVLDALKHVDPAQKTIFVRFQSDSVSNGIRFDQSTTQTVESNSTPIGNCEKKAERRPVRWSLRSAAQVENRTNMNTTCSPDLINDASIFSVDRVTGVKIRHLSNEEARELAAQARINENSPKRNVQNNAQAQCGISNNLIIVKQVSTDLMTITMPESSVKNGPVQVSILTAETSQSQGNAKATDLNTTPSLAKVTAVSPLARSVSDDVLGQKTRNEEHGDIPSVAEPVLHVRSIQLKSKRKTPPKTRWWGTENNEPEGRRLRQRTLSMRAQFLERVNRLREAKICKAEAHRADASNSQQKLSESAERQEISDRKPLKTEVDDSALYADVIKRKDVSVIPVETETVEVTKSSVDVVDGDISISPTSVKEEPVELISDEGSEGVIEDGEANIYRRRPTPPKKYTDYVCKSGRHSKALLSMKPDEERKAKPKRRANTSNKERFFLDGEPYNVMMRFIKQRQSLASQNDGEIGELHSCQEK